MSTEVTVLLVEDNPSVLLLMERALAPEGYTVLTAADGDAALRVADEPGRRIDLLVADLVLPGLGGRELTERLSQRDPGLAIVLISGYSAEEAATLGLPAARVVFLDKPFSAATFRSTVRRVLGRDDPERESP